MKVGKVRTPETKWLYASLPALFRGPILICTMGKFKGEGSALISDAFWWEKEESRYKERLWPGGSSPLLSGCPLSKQKWGEGGE